MSSLPLRPLNLPPFATLSSWRTIWWPLLTPLTLLHTSSPWGGSWVGALMVRPLTPSPPHPSGVVYAAEYAGAPVAVKVLIGGDGSGADFAHEVAMLRALKHPDLVLFMGVVQLSAGRGLVQELVRGGTLRAALTHGRLGGWPERLSVALDLATGVAFMHAQQVLHRDLKAENVLLEPLTPSPSLGGGGGGGSLQAQLLLGAPRPTPVRAKIADLGLPSPPWPLPLPLPPIPP